MNNNILRNLSYGVYVISTMDGERPTGCIANSAMQITSEPATMAISMNHDNYTNQCIAKTGKVGISILSENSDPGIIGTFGFQSGKNINKFDKVAFEYHEGIPVVKDSCGYIILKVVDKLETSTHTVFLAEMIDADVFAPAEQMTYAYYHKVVKGKSPKNAPTYLPDEPAPADKPKNPVWRCIMCGYEYTGDVPFEELPDSWTCPVCGSPKEAFEKVS